ncbi:MAG: MacS family sensor histidine kinase [Nocardioidaceae bacterium]
MTSRITRETEARGPWTVEDSMFRALAILRVLVVLNMLGINAYRWRTSFDRPGAAVLALAAITAWTGFAVWAYDDPRRRRPSLLVADLAVTLAAILVTPLVKVPSVHATLPGFWVMGAVLAWAVHWHWRGGLFAAAVVTVADLSVRVDVKQTTYSNIFLLVLGGLVVGYCTGLLKEMASARDRAEREAAVAAERARLARAVHDGVLQVLSLVQRRGLELGGEAAELGRLAGEQEHALRALVQGSSARPPSVGHGADLVAALSALQSRTVTVSAPAGQVVLPSDVVDELVAVVRACLDNVARHVGEEAPAWVLVESLDGLAVISVRDEGPGIPDGRLDEACAEGRLGVSESICGRMDDLGGKATLMSIPGQGTEWELTVPVSVA